MSSAFHTSVVTDHSLKYTVGLVIRKVDHLYSEQKK